MSATASGSLRPSKALHVGRYFASVFLAAVFCVVVVAEIEAVTHKLVFSPASEEGLSIWFILIFGISGVWSAVTVWVVWLQERRRREDRITKKHFPIDIGFPIQASASNMISLRWKRDGIVADFRIPHDKQNILRVVFDKTLVVRILDEMPLSTEEPKGEGLVREHFAYRVTGSKFWRAQSSVIPVIWKAAEHFRFVTGRTCLDVIAVTAPHISVVPLPASEGG